MWVFFISQILHKIDSNFLTLVAYFFITICRYSTINIDELIKIVIIKLFATPEKQCNNKV